MENQFPITPTHDILKKIQKYLYKKLSTFIHQKKFSIFQ